MRLAQIPEQPELNAFDKVYKSISKDIVSDILSIDLLNYSEIKANQIRKKTDANIRRLNNVGLKSSKILISSAYNLARQRSETSLRILGRNALDRPELEDVHKNTIQVFTNRLFATLILANGSIRKSVDNFLFFTRQVATALLQLEEFGGGTLTEEDQDFILNQMNKAVEKGLSRSVMSRRIRDIVQRRVGDGQLIDIKGRYYRINKYADLVARTEMRASQSRATVNSCNQYGNDLVQVSEHGTTTEVCLPHEGQTYSISGKDPDYRSLDDEPPYHPNCMHFLIPTSREAIKFEESYKG